MVCPLKRHQTEVFRRSFSDQLEQVLSDLAVDTRQDRHEATFFW